MKQYKSNKRYQCPYCSYKGTRNELMSHIEKKHESLIPEEYNALRVVYEIVNHKNHGTCMICKQDTYEWDDRVGAYKNLCSKESCRESVRATHQSNMIRVYNKPTLLNDEDQQAKMLANRSISGKYKFQDGGVKTYTGTYERKTLEFMDKVMNISSDDIVTPGPVLSYEYKGESHKWITDIYYIPANLIIEIKDGGSNPNNRNMESYREKQIAKETMITDAGTYNYLRLTDNAFIQLFTFLADMKMDMLDNNPRIQSRIHEYTAVGAVGGIPPQQSAYIVQYGMNNTFGDSAEGYALADLSKNKLIKLSDEFDAVNENYVFNGSDIVMNFDNWKPEQGKNILYVTGLSGSGKTTLGEQYEKEYHAKLFELDGVEHNYDSSGSDILKRVKEKFPKFAEMIEDRSISRNTPEWWKELPKVYGYIEDLMYDDPSTLYIIEGIQIFFVQDNTFNPSILRSKPIIIKGTSSMVSQFRRYKRSLTSETDKESIVSIITNHMKTCAFYKESEQYLKKFKKGLTESSIDGHNELKECSFNFLKGRKFNVYRYRSSDTADKINAIREAVYSKKNIQNPLFIPEHFLGHSMLSPDQFEYEPGFDKIDFDKLLAEREELEGVDVPFEDVSNDSDTIATGVPIDVIKAVKDIADIEQRTEAKYNA